MVVPTILLKLPVGEVDALASFDAVSRYLAKKAILCGLDAVLPRALQS